MMSALKLISADSHMTEPGDLWVERLDRRFRDEAPRVIENPKADGPRCLFVGPGLHPLAVAAAFAAGKGGDELREHMSRGYEAARPSGWDPAERIKDQELDGIEAEVLYPTLGIAILGLKDGDLQLACVRAYNDWVAEFAAYNPRRLVAVAVAPLLDPQAAAAEAERAARRGMRGILVIASATAERPYSDPAYDPLWRALSETGLPVSLHKPLISGMPLTLSMPTPGDLQIYVIHVVEQCLTRMVYGGVLERFPKLRVVSAENDVGWMANWISRLDHVYGKMAAGRRLAMRPSEYVRRQVWGTFQDDPVGVAAWRFFGEDNYMWASDFPHADSTFPDSRRVVAENFATVPDEVTRKIVHDTAARLYAITQA